MKCARRVCSPAATTGTSSAQYSNSFVESANRFGAASYSCQFTAVLGNCLKGAVAGANIEKVRLGESHLPAP